MVESFGAFTTLTVIEPGVVISFDAHNVFNSWCPERIISLLAPSDRCMSYKNQMVFKHVISSLKMFNKL